MATPFHGEREVALEKALRGLLKAARHAVVSQQRADYWAQFGTNSTRLRAAEEKRDKAIEALESAEANADEALNWI